MQVLLLDPADSPDVGPWSRERWDLIVDLGKSSQFSAEAWSRRHGCSVLRSDSFREGIADAHRVRELFSADRGRLIDEEGIDWWSLASLLIAPEALAELALRRLAAEISPSAEIWATRSGGPAGILAVLLNREFRTFGSRLARATARIAHYAGIFRRFSPGQIKEIFLDKYDSGYQRRARFARHKPVCSEPVALVPSAYGNVSRMAAAYAKLLPRQTFLTVVTRRSGKQFVPPANVQLRNLADYARGGRPVAEITSLMERWDKLRTDLGASPDLKVLAVAGVLDSFSGWICNGLSVRDAWREVLEREPVSGVLCGDDSNCYTLLPVLLAARRKIPTVDFHHGAFDGRYLLKDLPSDVYLAKNEMERDYLLRVCGLPAEKVVVGAPSDGPAKPKIDRKLESESQRTSAIFFSEPYEVVGMRAAEVYRELLPRLCRLARENGRDLVIKLHPFESRQERLRMVQDILDPEEVRLVTVIDGPLTDELMARAWFGITVESTTAIDCQRQGVQCFLCGWLTLWPFEYIQQYARFGVGEELQSAEQIAGIPGRLAEFHGRAGGKSIQQQAVDPDLLQRWLASGLHPQVDMRPLS